MSGATLVLRDRTNADPRHVLALALDELVASGVWNAGRGWRRLRRAKTLAPVGAAPAEEPLRAVDALLRRAVADHGAPVAVAEAARWAAVHASGEVDGLARRTLDDLIARGLVAREGTRLAASPAGAALLEADPPPTAVRPSARDAAVRAEALRALSPPAREFLKAYWDTRRSPVVDVAAGGDNRTAAFRTGTGT